MKAENRHDGLDGNRFRYKLVLDEKDQLGLQQIHTIGSHSIYSPCCLPLASKSIFRQGAGDPPK